MLLAFPLAATLALTVGGEAQPSVNRCVKVGEYTPISDQLRPAPIIRCDYSAEELGDRLLTLTARKAPLRPDIGTVERALSLPRLETAYDASRTASYLVQMKGPADSWHALLSFDESFYPTDAERRPRFRGPLRPTLIDPRIRGEVRLDVRWLGVQDSLAKRPCWLPVTKLERYVKRQGWRQSDAVEIVWDAIVPPSIAFERRIASVAGRFNAQGCLMNLDLTVEADRRAN